MSKSLVPFLAAVAALLFCTTAHAAGLLVPRDGSPPIAVRSHRVTAVVEDGLARTTVRQTFVNPHGRALEALYLFPLPDGAALTHVAMEVGGKRLEGLIVERKRARKIYDEIVRSRRDPALVEQVGRNAFRLSVFPVLPDQETVVELTWIQHVPLSRGAFRYVYPLAIGKGAAKTEQDLTVTVRLRSSVPLVSVVSENEGMEIVRKGPGAAIASMERTGAALDEDIVVSGRVEVTKPSLAVSTFRTEDGDGWFLAVITPPAAKEKFLIPRDVILVLDTSGSMRDDGKIHQAKASALWLLDNLREADRVNVLRFSSSVHAFAEAPVPATAENLARLREFVTEISAGGSTALGDALRVSTMVPEEKGRVRTVVLLTDGRPTIGETDPAKLVESAKLAGVRGLRIFPFGVGTDVQAGLLNGIAQAGRGRAEIFRPGGEIESRLTSFLHRTSSPMISDIALTVDGLAVRDVFPRPLPDAYLGEQVVIAGRYSGGGERSVTAAATVGGRPAKLTATADFRASAGGSPAVRDLYARMKLDFLEAALRLRSTLADDAYYAALSRGAYSTKDEIVEEMIHVSLEHGVQCAYTSFLVLLPEDRQRLDPRDAESLAKAMDRARQARADASPTGEAPPADDGPADAEVASKTSRHFFGGPSTPSPGGARSSGGGTSHGGAYRGPAGQVPPGSRDPSDPQPAPGSPAPAPEPLAPPAGGAIATPGGSAASPRKVTFEDWLFWWGHNGPAILTRAKGPSPRGADVAEAVAKRIRPALLKVLEDQNIHSGIRRRAVIALARCGSPDFLETVKSLAGDDRGVHEASVLALGVRGEQSEEVRAYLLGLLVDTSARTRIRAFAAVSLGLLRDAHPDVLAALSAGVTANAPAPDVPVACLQALGLIGSPDPVPVLIEWLTYGRAGGRKMTSLVRSHVVQALGRIGDPRALSPVLAALRKKDLTTRRSAMIAVGQILPQAAPTTQIECLKMLDRFLRNERDQTAVNFGLIAVGRIGARADAEVRDVALRILFHHFEKGNRRVERPYAALGLGLVAFAGGGGEVERIAESLRGSLAKSGGDPVARGAVAIALGMTGDDSKETIEILTKILADRGQSRQLRGAAAIALALIDSPDGVGPVREALLAREDRGLRADVVAAAGILSDPTIGKALARVFVDPRASQVVLGEAAVAVGRRGAPDSVAHLLAILEPGVADGTYPDLTRCYAAVALGLIARDRTEDPLDRLAVDLNYRAVVPALEEVLSYR